ncbi:MAG TPA: hypothetical protein PKD64_19735 [Pirellulaceae bacterium]|nr:hypothetical protein [Pirellulaceae bacterium]HMO94423.1 hypothetical protein [Pirellulaceae bacterium]
MTFKLPNLPSPRAGLHELADFAEIAAWENGQVSEREIIAYLGRADDNDDNDGVNDAEEGATNLLPEVMNEIERRVRACNGGYPFSLSSEGTVLRFDRSNVRIVESSVYRYLLLTTRLNMLSNKIYSGLDGTLLLEELAAHVFKNYLGARSKSLVFGTAVPGAFKDKVENLCHALKEGVGFRNFDGSSTQSAVDDKLDAVAWIPFSDETPGQLIIVGQCKTGTNWRGLENQMQPKQFATKWLKEPFLVTPLRVFCLSEAIDRTRMKSTQIACGILFDRCRLVDFCNGFDCTNIEKWTTAAFDSFNLGDLRIS